MRICFSCDARFTGAGWQCPECGVSPAGDGYPLFAPDLAEADDGFDRAQFSLLARLEEGSFWFDARSALIVWALRRYFPSARMVLEVGCGTGVVLAALREAAPDLHLHGVELFVEGLAIATQRVPDAVLLQADARRLPFENEFDLVGCFDVAEHIDDDERVFDEIRRVLRPEGGLLLTVPQHPWLWSAFDEAAEHKRRYTRAELAAKLARADFKILRATSFVSLLLPALAIARASARGASAYDPALEHRSARRFHPLLAGAMALERLLIKGGASFPAGGSLLVVAQRAI